MINRLYSYFQVFLGVFILVYAGVRAYGFFFAGSEGFAADLLGAVANLLLIHVVFAIAALAEMAYKKRHRDPRIEALENLNEALKKAQKDRDGK